VVAIDGKTVRRSGSKTSKRKKDLKGPIHIVSAFATRQRLVLGQVKVGEKSNEIVAIPKLLRMLKIEGAVVTIDAMGCQREIAQTILDMKADYILALKGNQGTLEDDVKLFVDSKRGSISGMPRSAATRPSMAIMAGSKLGRSPSFTMSNGYRNDTTGPV
jgi:hypothetical protein